MAARKPLVLVNGLWQQLQSGDSIAETDLSFTDVTNGDVTSTKHGFAPKSPNDTTKFLTGGATPSWAVPPGTTNPLLAQIFS